MIGTETAEIEDPSLAVGGVKIKIIVMPIGPRISGISAGSRGEGPENIDLAPRDIVSQGRGTTGVGPGGVHPCVKVVVKGVRGPTEVRGNTGRCALGGSWRTRGGVGLPGSGRCISGTRS